MKSGLGRGCPRPRLGHRSRLGVRHLAHLGAAVLPHLDLVIQAGLDSGLDDRRFETAPVGSRRLADSQRVGVERDALDLLAVVRVHQRLGDLLARGTEERELILGSPRGTEEVEVRDLADPPVDEVILPDVAVGCRPAKDCLHARSFLQ